MRYSKRYIFFTALLFVALVLKFNNFRGIAEETGHFRGADLEREAWNPLIAKSVNDQSLSIAIDNRIYTNQDTRVYMDENLNLMVPLDIVRDSFNCSVHLYDEDRLLVEKYSDQLTMTLDMPYVIINDEEHPVASALTKIGGRYFVPAEVLSEYLGYTYSWDIGENEAHVVNASAENSILPSRYDLREKGRSPLVKNQGDKGTCWAAASLAALESSLMPENPLVLSTDHMSLENAFGLTQNDGGEYTMSLAYLTGWQGPVLEEDDPYDGVGVSGLAPVMHIQEAQVIESKDFERIKEAVFKYGAVQTSIYSTLQNADSQSTFFNRSTNAYCYLGAEKPNHDVVIIGWDDNYSKENFNGSLEGDGAFICQNSWGEEFGDRGVFYVSYYDTNVGIHNLVYTGVEDTGNYDVIYQSDLCGWVGQLGYSKDTIFGANVYTAQSGQTLKAAGFYATGRNTEYEVYVSRNWSDTSDLNERQMVASGKLDNAGYYTVDFNQPVNVEKGERFAIIVKLYTPDSLRPMAIEYIPEDDHIEVDLTDGEGYISAAGKSWEHVEETQACNLCIKAYAAER